MPRITSMLLLGAVPLLCGCFGLRSGDVSNYPDYDGNDIDNASLSPENHEDPGISLGEFKLREEACEGIGIARFSPFDQTLCSVLIHSKCAHQPNLPEGPEPAQAQPIIPIDEWPLEKVFSHFVQNDPKW